MSPSFFTSAPRRLAASTLLAVAGLSAGAAQAGGVQWSIGIQLPAPPVIYYPAPPQHVYAPQPVYVHAAPRVVYVQPQRPWPRHHHHHRPWEDDDRWDRGGGRWGGGGGFSR